ncbi:MAG: ABC transporter permease [Armatimonadota bacterium]|nr:ABC transporter permease [Armatimonadota bacterium]
MSARAIPSPSRGIPWDRLGTTLLRAYLMLAYAFLFAPIAVTIITSFNADRFVTLPWRGFTWHWYELVVGNPDLLVPLRNSVLVATAVGLTSVVLGFLGAYGLTRTQGRWQDLYMLALISPLAVPWILLGLGLLVFFTRIGLPKSLLTVWITHTIFAAPLAMLIIRGRLLTMRRSYEEAAWDLGASRLRTIWEVVLPLTTPGLVGAFLLTFTLSFDEFILAWFVCGFDVTLPVKIWGLMRSGINPTISAIGTIVFGLSISLSVLGQALQRRGTAS